MKTNAKKHLFLLTHVRIHYEKYNLIISNHCNLFNCNYNFLLIYIIILNKGIFKKFKKMKFSYENKEIKKLSKKIKYKSCI